MVLFLNRPDPIMPCKVRTLKQQQQQQRQEKKQ